MPKVLSSRLQRVLSLAATGLADKEIAVELGISANTVAAHWKRLRQHFDASSRTEIVAKMLDASKRDEAALLQEEIQRLLFEMAERDRAEAALRRQNEELEAEVARRTGLLANTVRDLQQSVFRTKARLEYLEALEATVNKMNAVILDGEFRGSWRKDFCSNSSENWGYPAEDLTSGRTTMMDIMLPESIPAAMSPVERVMKGERSLVMTWRGQTKDGRIRDVLEFLRVYDLDAEGVGRIVTVSLDVTDWKEPLKEKVAAGWPDIFPI